ncbi:MAG TPA: hypothetical protein VFV08_06240, partial [Puia sp.]|nr:hypothetical protein [Puia sp.]
LHNKTPFLRALVAFQEYTLEQNSYAVGFPGKGNHLLNRVLRIVNNHNKTLTNMEKILLATGIVAIGLATIAFTQAENSKPKIGMPSTTSQTIYQSPAPPTVKIDSVPETKEKPAGVEKSSFLFSRDGKSYRGTRINGKVTELYVDGQKVPDSKLRDYQKVFEEFDRDMKQNAEDLEEKERAVKVEKEAVESQAQAYKVQAEVMALSQADMQAQQLEQAQKAEQYNKMALDLAIKQNQIMKVEQDVQVAEINAKLAKVETSPRTVIINGVTYVPASPSVRAISPKAYTAPPAPPTQAALGINDPVYSIIKDLRAEGLISEDLNVNLSFTLNSSKLIVNGTTQPGEIHKRFANKYIHNSKDHIIYSSSKNSTHTDIYVQ